MKPVPIRKVADMTLTERNLLAGAYGLLILASGLMNWSSPSAQVLGDLHSEVWWGAFLAVFGLAYVVWFRPKR